jgi:hypothetical protein
MKIDPLASRSLSPPRRKQRAEGPGSGDFAKQLADEVSSGASAGGSASVGKVDALLALQEVPDSLAGEARAQKHCEDLLDELERLRLGLLAGALPRAQLVRLNRLLAERREQTRDPRLAAIVAEIELRAAVELAKLER